MTITLQQSTSYLSAAGGKLLRMARLAIGLTAALGTTATPGHAAETDAPPPSAPLAELPSPPGPHLARIEAMSENSWLNLGSPAPDPNWGKARGRSYSSKMAYAPDLRGAFLFGEGPHGAMFRKGRYGDELYFYDINAHRWICAWPGTDAAGYDMIINKDGFEATPDGMPVPVASMVHAYELITYDTHARRFMSMPASSSYWRKQMPQRTKLLQQHRAKLNGMHPRSPIHQASPWFYDPATGRWARYKTETPSPRSHVSQNLIYLPSIRKTLYYGRGMWLYDAEPNAWQKVRYEGDPPISGWDALGCYDPRRDRVYLGGGKNKKIEQGTNSLWIYDVQQNKGIRPQPKGGPIPSFYQTSMALMHCDTVNDVVVVFIHRNNPKRNVRRGIYVYSPAKNEWSLASADYPETWRADHWKTVAVSGFYDPELNVHLIHVAGDGADNGVIMAYRYGSGSK